MTSLFNLGKNKTKLGKQVFMHISLSIAGCKSYACKWTDLSLYDFQFKAVEQLLSIEDQLAEPSPSAIPVSLSCHTMAIKILQKNTTSCICFKLYIKTVGHIFTALILPLKGT